MAGKSFVWKIMNESIPRGVHHAAAILEPQSRPDPPQPALRLSRLKGEYCYHPIKKAPSTNPRFGAQRS